ncbi:MAG: prolyl oligopeptidase family serine peptidase [Chitinophagaceae bacterium]
MRSSLVLLITVAITVNIHAQSLHYPAARKTDTVDNYFGTKIPDPYRWLEDDNSDSTKAWVQAENKVTFGYLEKIPFRDQFKKRLLALNNYAKYSAPFKKGKYYYFYKNDGLQNQSVLYRQEGLNGKPEVIIDPNKLSEDGTTSLSGFTLSKDGRYAVVGISKAGSDWETYYVRDMLTGKNLPEELDWVKVSGAAWQGNGFYYSRYPAPVGGKALSGKNENHLVYYHTVGKPQSDDKLIYQDSTHPLRFNFVNTTEDERYAVLFISDPTTGAQGNALFYADNQSADKKFIPIIKEAGKYSYYIVDNIGDKFLLQTNDSAPNSKIILYDTKKPGLANCKLIVPEKTEPLQGGSTGGGKLFLSYLKDVTSRLYVCNLDGSNTKEIALPSLGTAGSPSGEKTDQEVFYTFTSFTFPPSIYKYDIATGKTSLFRQPELEFKPADFETKQVFYNSKDGTKVPMFILYKKGVQLNGSNPTLIYGYGGFNISVQPTFSASRIAFLEQGGVYALCNLRGGAEYGEKWHEGGRRFNKQNVFDDFIAGAEYLINNKYTSAAKLAAQGGSNGGLLIGAVINQRPELFKVAFPQVGVMDMLRFQKFTIGWNWMDEYGSSANEEDFKNLVKFSPLHNINGSLNYPAVMVTTADHDDRVVPAHSFKYAATLQDKYKGNNPVLIRIETNSGHGASNITKALELNSDIYAFMFHNMGITPSFVNKTLKESEPKKAF